jgi:hypothetical protein
VFTEPSTRPCNSFIENSGNREQISPAAIATGLGGTQAQLRHSDPRITLGDYGHVIGDSQRTAVEKVANLLAPSGPKSVFSGKLIQ